MSIETEIPTAKTPYSTAALADSFSRNAAKLFIVRVALIRLRSNIAVSSEHGLSHVEIRTNTTVLAICHRFQSIAKQTSALERHPDRAQTGERVLDLVSNAGGQFV
jgi:hypothetical protein